MTEFHLNRRRSGGRSYYCKSYANNRSEVSRRKRGVGEARRPRVPDGMKWCPDCNAVKPFDDFPRTAGKGDGYLTYCKPCHNVRGKEARQRLYGGSREYRLRRRYGITQLDVEELLAEQGGVCAICGAPGPEHVDHDHQTGYIRGILCFNCTGGLGQFRDSVEYLGKAITYLEGSTWARFEIHPGVYQLRSRRHGRHPSRSS